MHKKRPCSMCRRWFVPDPRVGDRQRTCGAAECQRERHRQADRKWHKQHPDYDQARRLLKQLAQAQPPGQSSPAPQPSAQSSVPPRPSEQSSALPRPSEESGSLRYPKKPPLSGFPWDLAQDVMGAQATVIIAGVAGVLVHHVQEEIRGQVPEVTPKLGRHGRRGAQDEIERVAPS
jgi:hypothetical protein